MTDPGTWLSQGAEEIRIARAEGLDPSWVERLATRMEQAALLPEPARELEVKAITRSLVDGGPTDEDACPSFWGVVDFYQRQSKRSR
jgi:hypothetical protein